MWPICEPVVVKEAAAVVTVVVKRSKISALKTVSSLVELRGLEPLLDQVK